MLALSLLASAFTFPAQAANIAWTNTSGGSWSVAANWSPNSVPVASSDVFITNNGTYTVTMDVSPTISSLTLGGISGVQTLTNTSKTLTLSLASEVNTNGVLGMSAGVLSGSGSLSINGLVHWNGGSSGSGFSVTVQSNAVLNIESTITLSGVFTNQGTVNWLAGTVNLNTNAPSTGTIWNQANGLFDIQCDQAMGNSALLATFHNAGLVRKRVTAGTTTVTVFMDNTGTVQAQTGTISFFSGSTLVGSFQANSGAAINFTGGTYTLSSPPNFQGPGPVQITGGSLTLNAFTGTYTLVGTTLVGQNTIADTGIINLNGSNLGSGATLTIASNAVVNIQATTVFSGVVTNLGTVNWLAGAVNLNTNAPATGTIWNQANGLFDIQCDQAMGNSALLATFHNAGLVRKRVTAGTTTVTVFMDNTGTVQAQTGTINFANGSTLVGSFQANSGAAINFTGGTYTLNSPPNFQGPGPVKITGGNLTLNAFTGTFTLTGPTLIGQSVIADTGIINLNGSSLGSGATLTILSNAVVNITNSVTFSGVVTNLGTVNWLVGVVSLNTNAPATGTIWNQTNGLFDIQCDQAMGNSALLATFHNAGLVRKRVTAGTTTITVFMDNTGTVQAQTGTINIGNGGTLNGSFQANSGAAINFSGGTYTLSSPPNFQGPGPVQITGGNLTLNAFTGTYTLSGTTLVGQNTVAATGIINLNGSNLGPGATLTILSNAVVNITNSVTFSGVVTNLGTVNWLVGVVSLNTNAPATGTIWNQTNGLFDIQCDQAMGNSALLATFHNAGLVRKRVTAGTTTITVFMDNTGTVQAQTGTINIGNGGTLNGSFQANSGAAINFSGGTYTLSSPPNFQGPGPVQITANTTLNAFTGTFTLTGGTLVGQNTVAATGIINLNGPSLGSGATLTIANNAVLNIQTTTTFSGMVTNLGTINWLAGAVNLNTNAPSTGTIWNQVNGLFDIQCDQTLGNSTFLATFHNVGLLRKRVTAGTTAITVKLDNTGTIQAQTGVIGVQGPYTESPAATLAISISALPPGTGFGKIQFSAAPTFAANFTLGTLGGYRPNPGDSFFVIAYPSATGDFTSFNGLDLGSGLWLTPRFSASGLTLVASSYPVGPSPTLTLNRTVSNFLVAWPTNYTGWQLQSTTNLASPSWTTVPVTGINNTIPPYGGPQEYFRLLQ